MEFENKYLERLVEDLDRVRAGKQNSVVGRDSIFGLDLAFEKVKEKCVEEVLRVKETNEDLGKYVEVFSNSILTTLMDLKADEAGLSEKVSHQVEIINEMIAEASSKREELLLAIRAEMEKEREENVSPTARMARAALPPKKSKKKKSSDQGE